jgi:CBS domain-containing protein
MNVEDVMTREVVTVPPGASLKDAARLLVEHRVSGLPVVSDQHQVLGVVSEADVLPKEATENPPPGAMHGSAELDPETEPTKLEARLVGEAMTAPPITIEADRPVSLAARRMLRLGVNRLPVVEDGKLVGIVTRADLVRAFARSDAEIAREIREDVVVRGLRLDVHTLQVEVEEGEVTLAGMLDNRVDAQSLEALVGKVPGVVGIRSNLARTDEDSEC